MVGLDIKGTLGKETICPFSLVASTQETLAQADLGKPQLLPP